MRRLVRDISSVLIISGLLLMLDAGVTLVWQEPVTAAIGLIKRGEINKRFLSYQEVPLTRWIAMRCASLNTLSASGSRSSPAGSSAAGRRRRDRAHRASRRSARASTSCRAPTP